MPQVPSESTVQQGAAIDAAAKKNGVPAWMLLGIYGAESDFGQAYKSGGTTYGWFGLTAGEWNPSDSFAQDANIAAQTLSNLYRSHGNNWDAALSAYSGGGYTSAHLENVIRSAPLSLITAIKDPSGGQQPNATINAAGSAVSSAANTVSSAADATASIASLVTSGSFWLRVLEGIGGVVLLVLGLHALTGGSGNPITVTTGAAKKAAVAAAV